MNILLDGSYFTSGDIDEVAAELKEHDSAFDGSRLSYDPESQIQKAKARVLDFAENARSQAIGEPGAGHREALMAKGALAALTIAHTNSQLFDEEIVPAITAAFEAEAERRGRGESSSDLMAASAKKMLGALMVHGLVEGRVKRLEEKIEVTPVDELEVLLADNQAEAQAELSGILEAR